MHDGGSRDGRDSYISPLCCSNYRDDRVYYHYGGENKGRPMKCLVCAKFGVLVIELNSMEVVDVLFRHGNHSHYYGATWNEDFMLFSRRNDCGKNVIDIFNKDMSCVDVIHHSVLDDIHQIYWHDGRVYCANAAKRDESYIISISFPDQRSFEIWDMYPKGDGPKEKHLNSIFIQDDRMYVLSHGLHHSNVYVFSYPDRELIYVHKHIDDGCHNVYSEGDEITALGSNYNRVVVVYGEDDVDWIDIDVEFPRGLAVTEDYYIVGGSGYYEDRRPRKWSKKSSLSVFDRDWNVEAQMGFRYGQVYDVRLLDVEDFAHNGIVWKGLHGC